MSKLQGVVTFVVLALYVVLLYKVLTQNGK